MSVLRIRSSIAMRTTLLVLGVALCIGLVANEMVGLIAWRYETESAQNRVLSLLAVVEPSASAACFVGDRRLAEDTAHGLLNSPSIAAVEIRGAEGVLAAARHPGRSPTTRVVVRAVPSPFAKDLVVGEIRVYPDANETRRSVARYVWALRGLVLLMAAAMGAVLALTVMRTVVRPIKILSDRLNGLDASHGMRLGLPPGHEANEIGRLVKDINQALAAVEVRHRLEQQVQQAQAQKISSLGGLAGGVAHEFNNMLAGIMAYADLLLMDERDLTRQKYLRAILSTATRSSELTAKLLAYGRRGKNRVQAVDLNTAVRECLLMIQPSAHPNLRVIPDLEPGLSIDGDPSQIQQVLVNLCLNAVEVTPADGSLTVSTRAVELDGAEASVRDLPPGSYAELKVSDTGPGMSEEVLQRIFDPFFTTKTRKDKVGTGLGLSTVYGIVEAHHGCIEVASTVGKGSTFRVLLPLGRLSREGQGPETPVRRGEGIVLVVEDEPVLRDVAKVALESLGFSVRTAPDGRAGVAAFRELQGQLRAVLLDLKMPILDGRGAFEQMRSIDPSVPVIICTGYGENEEVQEMLSRGAAGMVPKPYRILQLSEALLRMKAKP